MKLDTSSYYPKSSIDEREYMPASERMADRASNESDSPDADNNSLPAEEEPVNETNSPAGISETQEPDLPPSEAETIVTGFSHLLSWVFVPLLMPVYAALIAFSYTILSFTAFVPRMVYVLIVFGINVAIPSLLVLLLKKLGAVNDVGLNNQKERFLPYVICIVCLIGTALFLGFKGAPQWLVMFYMGGAAAGIVEVIINRWWKISVHAAGIAGIVALLAHLLIYDYTLPGVQTWLLISIAVAGLLGSARVWLGRHTVWQVLAGYAVGFGCVWCMMLFAGSSLDVL